MSDTSNPITPGLRVGEYVLDEVVGQGAFTQVWRAHHHGWSEQLAAAKILTDPTFIEHLRQGVRLPRLVHPNIARIEGFDPNATPPYLLMEWVQGPSLRKELHGQPIPASVAVLILRQILSALSFAHERGVIHGDIKPENVLLETPVATLSGTASVKLTDFALHLKDESAGGRMPLRSDRSGGSRTMAYVAPEQRDGTPSDVKSDLFACGVVLFEMLTGERPAGTELPSELNPASPQVLDEVFRRANARRERRFATAAEFLAALPDLSTTVTAPSVPVAKADEDAPLALRPAEPEPPELSLRPAEPEPPEVEPAEVEPAEVEPAKVEPKEPAPTEVVRPAEPAVAPPPPAEEEVEELELAPAPAPQPVPQPMPRQPARQQPAPLVDNLTQRPVRNADEARSLFKRLYVVRPLDDGEVNNLSVRVEQWAEANGGLPGFTQRINLREALDCPYHQISLMTQYEGDAPHPAPIVMSLINPAASQDLTDAIEPGDFTPVIDLKTNVLPSQLPELITVQPIKDTVTRLLASSRAIANNRRIIRQGLVIARANVLSIKFQLDGSDYSVCFVGNTLRIVGSTAPISRIRDETLKRGMALLERDNVGAGLNDLRTILQTPNPSQVRAERVIVALRARLSAAYVALARSTSRGFGTFESINYVERANALLPQNDEVAAHHVRVRKAAFWLHAGPGIAIALIFGGIAGLQHPIIAYNYIAAAVGALIVGLIVWKTLSSRIGRTDVVFYHACLLPLAISGALAIAPTNFDEPKGDIISGVMIVCFIIIDVVLMKKFREALARKPNNDYVGGQPLDVLNQIQVMLEEDWDRLMPFYFEQPPLARFASTKITDVEPPPELAAAAAVPGAPTLPPRPKEEELDLDSFLSND